MSLDNFLLWAVLPLIVLAMMLAFGRLVRAKRLADRIIALDILAIFGIGLITVIGVHEDQPIYLDVAMIIALTNFLATVGFAYYLERKEDT